MTNDGGIMKRAVEDEERDRSTLAELVLAQDVKALHTLATRLIDERIALARGIEALGTAMTILRSEPPRGGNTDATAAIERVANEAIGLAREVVRAFTAATAVRQA